jgi:hypothetical protein
MTTLTEVQDLAADLHDQRPDWDLVPIMNHLLPYRTMAYDELCALATAWAREPKNRTPASLQWMRGSSDKSAESEFSKGRASKESRCYICGNIEPECRKLHDFEVSRGLPDPHDFETAQQAQANRSDRQWPDLADDLRAARAKVRADRARAEIRPTRFGNGSAALLGRLDDLPRKCVGCGGTLATGQDTHHPGCLPKQETP